MHVNYHPLSLASSLQLENMTVEKIKSSGVFFSRIKISKKLFDRLTRYYHEENQFWKFRIKGADNDVIATYFGLRFSISKKTVNNRVHSCWIETYDEHNAHEEKTSKLFNSADERLYAHRLKQLGESYYDHYQMVDAILAKYPQEIIEVDVWDCYQTFAEHLHQLMLNTPLIHYDYTKRNTAARTDMAAAADHNEDNQDSVSFDNISASAKI